jgi:peptidoglycan/xylan/chitin deacetylase (PgdA/CDA1 family)
MIRSVRPPLLYRKYFSELTWRYPGDEPTLYLTFDDGPVAGPTDNVLDTLGRFGAKATFFCVGRNIEEHRPVFERLVAEGHIAGNHTYHHLNGWKTSDKLYLDSAERTRSLVATPLFRPPYGRIRKSQVRMLTPRYRIIMWSVLSYDYDSEVTPEACLKNVIDHAGPGSIVVFHDSYKAAENLEYALPRVLAHFSEKGFAFKGIPL